MTSHIAHVFSPATTELAAMWQWLKDTGDVVSRLGPLVAAVSAVYVYLQYRRTRQWRRGDLAASLMARLETDEELAFACQALDWGTGPILVPQRYRPLMKRLGMPDEAVLDHDPVILAAALEPMLNDATLKSAEGLIYRHCFIKLFNHLDNISRLVTSRQVLVADLDGLDYWLSRLAQYRYALDPQHAADVFQPALAVFGYPRIPELGRRLGVMDWSVYDATAAPPHDPGNKGRDR